MAAAVLLVFLFFFLLHYAVETALLVVNLRHVSRVGGEVPPPLAGRVTEETARKSRDYTLAKGRFALLSGALGSLFTLAVLLSGTLPWLDGRLAAQGLQGGHRFVAFLGALTAAYGLFGLPFSLWGTFVLEERFGFNRTTWKVWLADRVKGLLLSLALGVPLAYATHAFMESTGRLWWLWLFGFLTAVQVVMLWLYPSLIAPLFNKFAPLAEGELRARLEAMARQAGFRNRGLFVMDASRRSSHSNAVFMGLWRPRIVLFDTLVERMTVDEAAAVLAHEVGHFKERHVQKRLALGLGTSLVGLWVISLLASWPPLFQAFGFDAPSWHAALALFALCGGAFTFFLAPLGSWLSRRHEYQADRFSVRLSRVPGALGSALVKLNGENLANLHPHPWYSRWHYTHPTLLERLRAIEAAARA
ncbi:MAG TPA: M48 family metallopeptidase [Anaeromyxobacteraceae bacterium]|nr:M48 family metallopeptidase [Anaeromyxobacteraceae bacterium]